jgi:hypothetical protein
MCKNIMKLQELDKELVSESPTENDNKIGKTKNTERKYTKNINNPRWKNKKNLDHKEINDSVTSGSSGNE